MILEEGTDEQMKECAWRACLPFHGERWLRFVDVNMITDTKKVACPLRVMLIIDGGINFNIVYHQHCMIEALSIEDWLHRVAAGSLMRPAARRFK